jgi:hypothetical protein
MVGSQFEPFCLHHPVEGLELLPACSHFFRQNGGFSNFVRVSGLVSAGDKSVFARPSLHHKFPFPARVSEPPRSIMVSRLHEIGEVELAEEIDGAMRTATRYGTM